MYFWIFYEWHNALKNKLYFIFMILQEKVAVKYEQKLRYKHRVVYTAISIRTTLYSECIKFFPRQTVVRETD